MHDRFHRSTAKVQFLGGGFGNGKTACVVTKAIKLAAMYPGSNGLIARSTYPKLNDTIRPEFFKWCPKHWIKRMPTKDDNTCILTNGSIINFRYVSQGGKNTEQTTSNLLSATYDWIIVDQLEDPEFVHKDFMDLMGRLRGNTARDPSAPNPDGWPSSGPRWFLVTSNPTRNWVYRELIRPLHRFYGTPSLRDEKLLVLVDGEGKPRLNELGQVQPLIELFEGSTYENVDNVGEDYIQGMLSTYTGSMRDRFVFGKWGALSGLVYSSFDEAVHVLPKSVMASYLQELRRAGYKPTITEAYDHGIASPSCYLLSFTDDYGNVMVLDGFYNKEQSIEVSAAKIAEVRSRYDLDDSKLSAIWGDPSILRRTTGSSSVVGKTVADMFSECGIIMQRANNAIFSGIAQVQEYLAQMPRHEHPITGMGNAPHMFICDALDFVLNEINEYRFKEVNGDLIDTPIDKNDHSMDTLKYLVTTRPRLATLGTKPDAPPAYLSWHEVERQHNETKARHRA